MLEFLYYFVAPVVECFTWAYLADDRPEARRLTVGCAVIVVAIISGFIFWVSWQRGFK